MPRVILTLLLLCHSFCPRSAEVTFADPGLLSSADTSQSRVVIVHNPAATRALSVQADTVASMVDKGVVALTGRTNALDAWRSLVPASAVVGVKVHSSPGSASGTRPAVVSAILRGLINAGHPKDRIVLWDRRVSDLRSAGFDDLASSLGVRLAGAVDADYDPENPYENSVLGQHVFGDLEVPRFAFAGITNELVGRKSHFSRLLTRDITHPIVVAPLLNHNLAGVSGIIYSVASAATDNFLRFESSPMLLARAVPEIFGNTNIADRIVLNVVDALIGQYEGSQRTWLQYSAAPNELRFGFDPVALDVLSIEELNRIRHTAGAPSITNRFELYENARWMELGTDSVRKLEILRIE